MMKNAFIQSIKDVITKYHLLRHGDSVLVAVSGGADSVCLLDVLNEIKSEYALSLSVAHVNHMLRKDESVRDADFVRSLCQQYDIPFYCEEVDVADIAKHYKISLEEAGRNARYSFFAHLKEIHKIDKIATAHNTNDNIETVCMRFLRGTGIDGLGGIPIVDSRGIIRPLLHTSREEIEAYIAQKQLTYITDSSNLTDDYTRNRIRHAFIPNIIENYNNNFTETLHENVLLFSDASQYLKKQVDSAYDILATKHQFGIAFDLTRLLQEEAYIVKSLIKKAIFSCIKTEITSKVLRLIYENVIIGNASSFAVNSKLNVYKRYNTLYFVIKTPKADFIYQTKQPSDITIEETKDRIFFSKGAGTVSFADKNVIYIKQSLCDGKTLKVRNRRTFDRIYMGNGHKSVKDLMIDEKIPHFLRDSIPILLLDDEIVWVCGVRDNPSFRAKDGEDYIKIIYSSVNADK